MKNDAKTAILSVVLAAGMTFGTTAFAEEGGPDGPPDHARKHWKEKADTNGDGAIDETEKAAAKAKYAEKREKWKHKADLNGDGKVDDVEKNKAIETLKEKKQERVELRNDTNQDGILDDSEISAAHAKRAQWKEKADRNDDGKVGPRERKIARKEARNDAKG